MKIYIVAAVSKNGVIGKDGKIPWHLPEDLKRFKKLTMGHAVIMGRKTFESIGRPLPERRNIVLTRRKEHGLPPTVAVADSLEQALALCRKRGEEKAFVIGGAEVYAQALPLTDEMILTHVDQNVDGDARFPEWDSSEWKVTHREQSLGVTYIHYERGRS